MENTNKNWVVRYFTLWTGQAGSQLAMGIENRSKEEALHAAAEPS